MEYNPKQFYCFKLKNIMKNCVEKYQGTFRCRQIIDNYNSIISDNSINSNISFDDYDIKEYRDIYKKLSQEYSKILANVNNKINNNISNELLKETTKAKFSNKIENDTLSIYDKIWNKYVKNINNSDKLKEQTDDDFYNSIINYDLNPDDVLDITSSGRYE